MGARKDRYEAVWDRAIAALHHSGDWAMPSAFDRLLIFGALNWSAQWYDRRKGASLDELTDAACHLFLGETP